MDNSGLLSAGDAAAELGISRATLYAYVSRGLIRSTVSGDKRRTRWYARDDVIKLKARQEARRSPAKLVEEALHWGTPVLDSAITLIDDGKLYYRGHDALRLACDQTVEYVASLIWTGDGAGAVTLFADSQQWLPPVGHDVQQVGALPAIERMLSILPLVAGQDLRAYDLRSSAAALTGARILMLLATIIADGPFINDVVTTLQHSWCPDDPASRTLLQVALIACADHELNVSTFTARCVASAGATPYGVVLAGLAALQGIKHGGQTERVAAFLRDVGSVEHVRPALIERIKRGEALPGFGQRLYADGDPRARVLLDMMQEQYPDAPAFQIAQSVLQKAAQIQHEQPTIDFALATLAGVLRLPAGTGLGLFALGRSIGWIGHAIEQYGSDQLIRPRARYVGPSPQVQ